MAVVPGSILHHHEHCTCVYQTALPSSRLKYLNKAVRVISLQIYMKYNKQGAGADLAIRKAHVRTCSGAPRGGGGGGKSVTACVMSLRIEAENNSGGL